MLRLQELGIHAGFVQDNHSHSAKRCAVRGLHFQIPPDAQPKLVLVVRGSILDVAVDLRRNSPTFGKHASAAVSANNSTQIYVPTGFAHGFMTPEPETEVARKIREFHTPSHGGGLRWDDPELAIGWPCFYGEAVLSKEDAELPPPSCLTSSFAQN